VSGSAVLAPARRSPRAAWRAWWLARHPRRASWPLTQRSVYILPTGAGWLYALLLLALLLGSINYQLNLGHLLTFLLASAGVVAIHATHATLRGLTLSLEGAVDTRDAVHAVDAAPRVHAGQTLELTVRLVDIERPGRWRRALALGRHGIALRWAEAAGGDLGNAAATVSAWVDVPPGGEARAVLGLTPARRGLMPLPALIVETRFPLGLLRAWSVWRPAASVWAWPAPEADAPPLPTGGDLSGDETPVDSPATAPPRHRPIDAPPEPDGVRPWRHGDSPRQVLWRLSARQLDVGGELLVRDLAAPPPRGRALTWRDTAALGADTEARLARLCAWLLRADASGQAVALSLPGETVAGGLGPAHRRACLDALTRHGAPPGDLADAVPPRRAER
jgi:uncharacterized protein (DUF58 family)